MNRETRSTKAHNYPWNNEKTICNLMRYDMGQGVRPSIHCLRESDNVANQTAYAMEHDRCGPTGLGMVNRDIKLGLS